MARIVAAMLFGALVVACGPDPATGPVRDDTGILVQPSEVVGCVLDVPPLTGRVVTDRQSGVAIDTGTSRVAVVWPFGYHARLAADVVEVTNADGEVVARTGSIIRLAGIGVEGRWMASPCQSPIGPPASA